MIERATTHNVSRAAVCALGLGLFTLGGCGGGSGGAPPLISTTTSVTASPVSVVSGGTVTLAAAVEYAPAETASGNVDFVDGSVTIGSSSLDAKGVGSLKIATLAVGSHSIKASYLGNSTTSASMSSAVTVLVKAKGALSAAAIEPLQVAISNGSEAATLSSPFKFAIAVNPEDIGCAQASSVLIEEGNQGDWRLYCPKGDPAAAEKSQRHEIELTLKGQLLTVASHPWFVDASGQQYILLCASPRPGNVAETTP